MRRKIVVGFLMLTALLILALPIVVSGQSYRDYRYDRTDRRDVHDAIARLDNASARLESDLSAGRERRVLGGLFWVRNVDNDAITEARDFRQSVRALRTSSRDGFALDRSVDEAQVVLNRGVELDRYMRLRTGRTSVDSDLAEIRSNLHLIADAYGLSMPY
jgi:hypothetical protein